MAALLDAMQYRILKKISPGDPPRVMGDQYAGRSKVTELLGPEFWSLIGPSTTVIDFGCGSGRHAVEIAKAGPELVLGVDICDLSEARELAAHEGVSDTCRFQAYADRQADVIVCLDSFEHFADPEDVLNHMIGLLKPGGRITISFGWTWYHPLGGHLFSVFPWAHLLFSETALIRWRSDLRGDGARRFAEVEGGLNRMTIHRFESMARRCGLLVEHFRCVPIRKLARLHCHLTREFTTATVRCVLRARAIAV